MCYTHFMNHTITYDIFELAKDLEKAGIAKEGIEAIVKFEKAKDEANLNALATKDDILLIRKDMAIVKRDIILALVVLIPTILKILEHFKI